jgi:hypothetical protein
MLILSGTVVFMPFWNARQGNWNRTRAALLYKQEASLDPNSFSHERIGKEIEALDASYVSPVQIPIFNIPVDIDDLSMLGGVAFIVLMLLLRISITRELMNLRCAFRLAGDDLTKSKCVYELVSMGQMLTVPQQHGVTNEKFWTFLFKFLMLVPLTVQMFTVYVNATTFQQGWQVD